MFLTSLRRFHFSSAITTKYINYTPGPPQSMFIDTRQLQPKNDQVLLKVKAVGINRAQCLHRAGKYKSTREVEKYLGLEAAGEVYCAKTKEKLYDGMALITGGAYAQWVALPQSHIIPLPSTLSFSQAAAIPQAWTTAFQLLRLANVQKDQHVVVYAGASGVGTAAIQLGKLLGVNMWAVVSKDEKGKICQEVGAKGYVCYKGNQQWGKELMKMRGGGVDAVLDCVGPDNVNQTIEMLNIDGTWVLYGLLSGAKTNLNLASILVKRINLISTTLKTRTDEYKSNLVQDFKKTAVSSFTQGTLRPIIYKTFQFDWKTIEPFVQAHKMMQSNQNAGKIVIQFK